MKKLGCIIILLCSLKSLCQNRHIADSLLFVIENGNLSQKERAIKLRFVAKFHPDLNVAFSAAENALKISEDIRDLVLQAKILEKISHIQRELGNKEASLQSSLKALQIYEANGHLLNQAATYNQIARDYAMDEDYQIAIQYFQKAKSIFQKLEDTYRLASTILNLGEAYRLAGYLDLAVSSFQEVLYQNKDLQNNLIEAYTLGNLGMVYSTQKRFALANKNLKTAIDLLKTKEDFYSSSVYIAELGEVYRKESRYSLAESKYLEALQIAKRVGLKEQIRDFSKMLTSLYEKTEKYKEALKYQKQFQMYQDSLVNKERIKRFEQQKSRYEIDKKQLEIGHLNTVNYNQQKWVIALSLGLLVFLGLAYLLFVTNKKVNKANVVLLEQKEIISKKEQEKAWLLRELNHRVKNNLQMISSLLNLQSNKLAGHPAQEEIIAGKRRVEALSLVHRKLYQEGVDTRIVAKEYISELVLGLMHGYDADFKPDFDIEETTSVGIDIAIPLALIVNELIINCLKYAYEGIENPTLTVRVKALEKERLDIEIIDNGIGFVSKEDEKTNSLGLRIINSLILQLEGTIEKIEGNGTGTHWKMNIKSA